MRDSSSVAKGALAGMAGGLVAAWIMVQFQRAWTDAAELFRQGEEQRPSGDKPASRENEDATMKAAGKLGNVVGASLDHQQRKKAGQAIHYAFGTLMGGLYGAAKEVVTLNGAAGAALYGTGVFITADEVAVPAAGLSRSPREYPLSRHAYGLASHVVFGLTTEVVRRVLRPRI